MMQLDNGHTALGLDGSSQTTQPWQVLVGKNTQLPGKALALGLHMGSAGHGQAKAACRPHRQPVKFIVRQAAISMALGIG